MERLKKHEDEQFFFRKELRARRGLEQTKRLERVLNWLYEKTSDYGQSLAKPALAFAWLWATGGAAIKDMGFAPGTAMLLSAANMLPFLPIKRDMTQTMAANSVEFAGIFHAVSLVQSTTGLILLFLLGLAFRNRFWMR